MPIGILFWVLMAIWIIFRGGFYFQGGPRDPWVIGGDFMVFVLLFLLGWHDFGFIVRYS
jgi:hypothetical protein